MSGLAQCPDRCIFMAATREMSDVFSIRRSRDVEILLKYLEDRHYPAVFIFNTSILTCDLSKIHKNNVHLNLAMHGSSGQLVSGRSVSEALNCGDESENLRRKLKSSSQQPPPTTPALSPSPPPLPFTRLSSSTLTNLSVVTWISQYPSHPSQ